MAGMINTEVDSQYIYDYEKTKFVPPTGKTLLIQGQTVEGIKEYSKAFRKEQNPAGWSAYWSITEFKGVQQSYKNVTGSTQNHQMLVDKFPNTVINSAMWMVGNLSITKNILLDLYDDVIKRYCNWAKTINRPIYLRIGYEFDGSHNQLEPRAYVKAYKHIVDIMRKEGATNIAFVWHSYAAEPYKNYTLSSWYPGDDYVDWVGISVFHQPYSDINNHKETNDVLTFAKMHKKPVMIAESNPVFGIAREGTQAWDDWFVNFFSFCYNKNIKAICFINEDWPRVSIPGISDWKDARLYNNAKISEAWFKETNKDSYLKQSADLFKILGYNKN